MQSHALRTTHLYQVSPFHKVVTGRVIASLIRKPPAERIRHSVINIEQRADVDCVFDGLVADAGGAQRGDVGRAHVVRMERQFLEEAERRAQFGIEGRGAPIVHDRAYEPIIVQSQRRDRGVRLRSEDALVEFGCERGEELPFAHAPLRRAAQHGLRPFAHRPSPELGAVQDRFDDVGDPAAAEHADEPELEPFLESMSMLYAGEAHQSGSAPRSAATPRSSRWSAAPTAAATVISKSASSEYPARCSAWTSPSVTR